MEEATFVVIGGGIAGVSCVEQLIHLCPNESVILVTATSMIKSVTNLSQLSQIIQTFDVQEENGENFAKTHENLKVVQGQVKSIDSVKQEIQVDQDLKIKYTYVILCHGARPKLFQDSKYIYGIRDTESVEQFQKHLKGAKKIVIVGNGGIATEMVHELKNIDIVWVIRDSSIVATFVDPGAGQFFLDELNKNDDKEDEHKVVKRSKFTALEFEKLTTSGVGAAALGPDWHSGLYVHGLGHAKHVQVETETEVKEMQEINDDEFKVSVTLTNGKIIYCDFVVSATGVIPNGDQIKIENLNLDTNKAIIVNEQMQTNLKNVYAAGDVCSCSSWNHSPLWFQMRLWTQARQMGQYAGQCVQAAWLGQKKDLDFCFEMFTHATKFFGFKVVLLGLFNGQTIDVKDYEVLLRVTKGQEYVKTVMQNGRMKGAVLIGETDLEETFENLILNQMDLSIYGTDLLDPNIDIEDYFD